MERGLYEQIADEELEAALEALVGEYQAQRLDDGDSHAVLAEHIGHLLTQVLRRQPSQDRLTHQVALCNRLIRVLGESHSTVDSGEQTLLSEVRRLLSVHGDDSAPHRPDTPLSETSLLTGTPTYPNLVSQLKGDLSSADRIDVLCSFIKWSGNSLLRDALETFCERADTELRVLTTSYMGATDVEAALPLSPAGVCREERGGRSRFAQTRRRAGVIARLARSRSPSSPTMAIATPSHRDCSRQKAIPGVEPFVRCVKGNALIGSIRPGMIAYCEDPNEMRRRIADWPFLSPKSTSDSRRIVRNRAIRKER